ncbi:phage head spike fiber domain-containing protein [Ferrovibrio sp.]|uniref:phage head spike fiber domain-containing protein n=1 Tax=Ferrovibrio sp. TaxID=1917215 RepID=UPI003D27E102
MIYPSLNLDARLYLNDANGKPGSASFTRASGATYRDAAGKTRLAGSGVLRHDFAPDGSYLGWLIEEQRSNVVLYSDLGHADWVPANGSGWATTKTAAYKDTGGYHAACRVQTPGNPGLLDADSTPLTQAGDYCYSLWAQSNTAASYTALLAVYGFGGGAHSTQLAITITPQPQRFTLPFNFTSADATVGVASIQLRAIQADADILAWDAQCERGSFPTSLIPTGGVAATRAADLLTLAGSSFALNQAEGTLLIRYHSAASLAPNECALQLSDAGGTNYLSLFNKSGGGDLRGLVSGAADLSFGGAQPRASHCLALAYKANDFALAADGAVPLTDNSGSVPANLDMLRIGSQLGFGNWLNGCIRHIAYFPRRLPNAELQDITRL